jgi:hypothetical protein
MTRAWPRAITETGPTAEPDNRVPGFKTRGNLSNAIGFLATTALSRLTFALLGVSELEAPPCIIMFSEGIQIFIVVFKATLPIC